MRPARLKIVFAALATSPDTGMGREPACDGTPKSGKSGGRNVTKEQRHESQSDISEGGATSAPTGLRIRSGSPKFSYFTWPGTRNWRLFDPPNRWVHLFGKCKPVWRMIGLPQEGNVSLAPRLELLHASGEDNPADGMH